MSTAELLARVDSELAKLGITDVTRQSDSAGRVVSVAFTTLGELLVERAKAVVLTTCLDYLADVTKVQLPEYWTAAPTPAPELVRVQRDSAEFEFVRSRFHVSGFSKAIVAVDRVQVRWCRRGWTSKGCHAGAGCDGCVLHDVRCMCAHVNERMCLCGCVYVSLSGRVRARMCGCLCVCVSVWLCECFAHVPAMKPPVPVLPLIHHLTEHDAVGQVLQQSGSCGPRDV